MSSPNQLSFLPDDYLERKAIRRANMICGGLSIIVLGAVGAAFAMGERSIHGAQERAALVEAQYAAAGQQIEQVEKMHARQRQIVQHAELAAALVEKVPRSNILAEFTNSLPAGASLLDVALESRARQAPAPSAGGSSFDQKKAALENRGRNTGLEPMEVHLRLSGIADNDVQVAQFITRLNASKLFKDVNLVLTDPYTVDKVSMRRFQIEMMLSPDAEVAEKK